MNFKEDKVMINDVCNTKENVNMQKIYSNLLYTCENLAKSMYYLTDINGRIGGTMPSVEMKESKDNSGGMIKAYEELALKMQLIGNEIAFQLGILEGRLFDKN